MRQIPIDGRTEQAVVRDAMQLRRRRLDKGAMSTREYAARNVRREMIEHLMRTNRAAI